MEAKIKQKKKAKEEGGRLLEQHILNNSYAQSPWTDKEDEKLREMFPFSTDEQLQESFNRSITSIKGRAYRLGIKKHWSMVQSVHKKNAKSRWTEIKKNNEARNTAHIRAGKHATTRK